MSANSNIKLFSGTSHPELAQLIAQRLGLPLGKSSIDVLPSGELSYAACSFWVRCSRPVLADFCYLDTPLFRIKFHESVREADVYIVSTASSELTGTNGALME